MHTEHTSTHRLCASKLVAQKTTGALRTRRSTRKLRTFGSPILRVPVHRLRLVERGDHQRTCVRLYARRARNETFASRLHAPSARLVRGLRAPRLERLDCGRRRAFFFIFPSFFIRRLVIACHCSQFSGNKHLICLAAAKLFLTATALLRLSKHSRKGNISGWMLSRTLAPCLVEHSMRSGHCVLGRRSLRSCRIFYSIRLAQISSEPWSIASSGEGNEVFLRQSIAKGPTPSLCHS